MQTIAIDWSGRERGATETIWLAHVRDGALVELENGRDREEVVAAAIAAAEAEPRTAVGLDFAFAFPAWYAEQRGWSTGREIWEAMREEAETLLAACEPPFWGRPGRPAQTLGPGLRETDLRAPVTPKSVFQIGGSGAVGTGSLRGMRHLVDLAEAGLAIWPFDDPALPVVVEIYPRLLTLLAAGGPVVKSRHRDRRAVMDRCFPEQDPVLRERAAGSDDAFDAAVSALVMARHADHLAALPRIAPEGPARLEGEFWVPPPERQCPPGPGATGATSGRSIGAMTVETAEAGEA